MKIYKCVGFFALLVPVSCSSPDTKSINSFSGALDATSISVLEAFEDTNRVVYEEVEINRARLFALRQRLDERDKIQTLGPNDELFVDLSLPKPRIPSKIIVSRQKALEGLRGYAKLLVELSDNSFTESFSSEIDGLGNDLKSFQGNLGIAGVSTQVAGFEFGPFVTALNIMGQNLIDAEAANSISVVAGNMQPQINIIAESLIKDVDALDEIINGRAKNFETALETVLVASSELSEARRFELYRDYASLNASFSERRNNLDRLKRALTELPKAHAAIADPERDDLESSIATFLRFADVAADAFTSNFKE